MVIRLRAFIALVLVSVCVSAQVVFCPPGATWSGMFTIGNNYPLAITNETITYTHDSIIENDTVKVLKMQRFFNSCNYYFFVPVTLIRQNGDTIFMRNILTGNEWEVLFNYAAQKGQSWTTSYTQLPNTIRTYSIAVDSVSVAAENGFPLRQLFVTVSYSSLGAPTYTYNTLISERYGWGYLFHYANNRNCHADIFLSSLCYSDPEFGTKYFLDYPCDYSNPIGLKENIQYTGPEIIKPVNKNWVLIRNASRGSVLIITDNTGKKIRTNVLLDLDENNATRLDVADLVPGLYFITLSDDTGVYLCRKIVKLVD